MKLSKDEAANFIGLHSSVLCYANSKLGILKRIKTVKDFFDSPLEKKAKIRDALCKKPELFDSFASENPYAFAQDELDIVRSWKNHVKGTFFVVDFLRDHTVFLGNKPTRAYGVLSLNDSLEDMLGGCAPLAVEAVLLPFKGKIVYDGLIAPYSISFGSGMLRCIKEDYKKTREKDGVVTTLPFSGEKL